MRVSVKPNSSRLLTAAAGILLSGSVLAATAASAQAAPVSRQWAHRSVVTVRNPGNQHTDPLFQQIDLHVSAFDRNPAGLPLTFTATGLPAGLSIENYDATHAAITGMIDNITAGPVAVTVIATDQLGNTDKVTFAWTAHNTITVANPGTQTTPVNKKVTAVTLRGNTDDRAAVPLGYAVTGLPPGLYLYAHPGAGVILGTPTRVGTYRVTVTVTDTTDSAGRTSFTWHVTRAPHKIRIRAPRFLTLRTGVPVRVRLTASDSGRRQITWTAKPLPHGLSIDPATGVIWGKPRQVGRTTTKVTAADETGSTGFATIEWNIIRRTG
jgi:hypothetical protein